MNPKTLINKQQNQLFIVEKSSEHPSISKNRWGTVREPDRSSRENPKIELRTYQKEVIKQIYRYYRLGIKSVLLAAPTGSGKTLTATHIVKDALSKLCKVLFIVHREPLIDQTVNTLINYGIPAIQIGYVKAGYPKPEGHELVIVASIQTLARRDYPEGMGLVIFDECHTTAFYNSARQLINHYSDSVLLQWSKVKYLHLTATPFRTKAKEGFCTFIQRTVKAPSIGELMKMGYLSYARHFGYGGLLDFSKLETGGDGDYKKSQLNLVCSAQDYNQEIVNRFLEICPWRKAIAFCAAVNQSRLLTQLFNQEGITAEHIQAETPIGERKAIFQRFKMGQTQILSSVGTLTEGFDEPSVEAVILARPTKSEALLIQMAGRGLRIHSEKLDCLLLDFGENFKRLGRIDGARQISLCPRFNKKTDSETTKECPQCHTTVNIFTRICPECGYEFPPSEMPESEDNYLARFGELLDEETKKKVTYIRSQRKSRFSKKLTPETLWELWYRRYPDDILCNDWLYQAVYRGDNSEAAQQQFLSYLASFEPQKDKWINFHMRLEFGASAITVNQKRKWWEVLQIHASATPEAINAQYRQKVQVYQGMEDQIKLLNWALDESRHPALKLKFESQTDYPIWQVGEQVRLKSRNLQATVIGYHQESGLWEVHTPNHLPKQKFVGFADIQSIAS